jgi:hypothetical protein
MGIDHWTWVHWFVVFFLTFSGLSIICVYLLMGQTYRGRRDD